jgi:quinol monooxygenase YgiN
MLGGIRSTDDNLLTRGVKAGESWNYQTLRHIKQMLTCHDTGGPMVILRFKIHSKPGKSDELMAVLSEIIPGARATEGVINLDIARTLDDPESFIATAVYEDGAALERQESAPEVHRAMAVFPDLLAGPPERTLFDASIDPVLV